MSGQGPGDAYLWGGLHQLSLFFHPELPDSEYERPRLLAGPEGCAPREQDPALRVGGRSLAQLQVREETWGVGKVRS